MRPNHPSLLFCFVFSFNIFLTSGVSPLRSQNSLAGDSICTVNLDTEQPAMLIELMHHIKSTHGSYSIKGVDTSEISGLILTNQNDTALNRMIDKLLIHPVYNYLSGIMKATVNGTVIKGNEAYRTAFLSLPWKEINMSSGYAGRITGYFGRGGEDAALEIIKYLSQNKPAAEDSIFRKVNEFLPAECRVNGSVTICAVIDGNRGSFVDGNDIVMELTSYNRANPGLFLNTAAHEMHHVLYGNWLGMYYSDSGLTAAEQMIFDWQMRLIYEGSAQLVNCGMYSQEVKELYNNRSLIAELFETWIDKFARLYSSDNAEAEYSDLQEYLYNTFAEELLKKYAGEKYKELMPHRPTADYYISYHIYNTVYQANGAEGLKYILLHPEELLNRYNESAGPEAIVPRIPEDVITIWKNVLQRSKKAR